MGGHACHATEIHEELKHSGTVWEREYMHQHADNGVSRDQVEQAALGLVPAAGGRVRGIAEREHAIVVALETARRTLCRVIFLESSGLWRPPNMLSSGPVGAVRPSVSSSRWEHGIADLGSNQVAPPGPERPETAWLAMSGLAARDALSIEVVSSAETVTVEPGDDGFFLTLLLARWGEHAQVFAHTSNGERVPIGPHSGSRSTG